MTENILAKSPKVFRAWLRNDTVNCDCIYHVGNLMAERGVHYVHPRQPVNAAQLAWQAHLDGTALLYQTRGPKPGTFLYHARKVNR